VLKERSMYFRKQWSRGWKGEGAQTLRGVGDRWGINRKIGWLKRGRKRGTVKGVKNLAVKEKESRIPAPA